MPEITLDTTSPDPLARFTPMGLKKARTLIARGGVSSSGTAGRYRARSEHGNASHYTLQVIKDSKGNILGVTCECASGKKQPNEARCYHAAAATLIEMEKKR